MLWLLINVDQYLIILLKKKKIKPSKDKIKTTTILNGKVGK